MNAIWKKIWPECCTREAIVEMPEVTEILKIGKTISGDGFQELESQDITEILECNEEDLSIEDIITQFGGDNSEDEISEEDMEISEKKKFNSKTLAEFLKLGSQLSQDDLDMNPDSARALQFRRSLTAALAPYEEFYRAKQKFSKQSLLTTFFKQPSKKM